MQWDSWTVGRGEKWGSNLLPPWASKEIGGKGQRRAGTFLLKDAKRVVGDARRFLEYYVLLYTNLDVYYAKCRAQCGNC